MEITNKLTDLEKKDQWNFGMDCSALMTNGHISFHDYRNNQNQNDHRSQWDYFIRKGFGYALDNGSIFGKVRAVVENLETGEKSLSSIPKILEDALNDGDRKQDLDYRLVGFQCVNGLSLEDKRQIEADLICGFVTTSENLDLNTKGYEFAITTHRGGNVVYVPDGTDKGVDKEELGKQLDMKTFGNFLMNDFTEEIKQTDEKIFGNEMGM